MNNISGGPNNNAETGKTLPWFAEPAIEISKQLTQPWDWAGAFAGLAFGLVVLEKYFPGNGCCAGISIGIAVSKSISATAQGLLGRRKLYKAAKSLQEILEENPITNEELLRDLRNQVRLWKGEVILDDEFRSKIRSITERLQ